MAPYYSIAAAAFLPGYERSPQLRYSSVFYQPITPTIASKNHPRVYDRRSFYKIKFFHAVQVKTELFQLHYRVQLVINALSQID